MSDGKITSQPAATLAEMTSTAQLPVIIDGDTKGHSATLSRLARAMQGAGSTVVGSAATVNALSATVVNRQRRVYFSAPEDYAMIVQEQFMQNLAASDADAMWTGGGTGTFIVDDNTFQYQSGVGPQDYYTTYTPLLIPFAVAAVRIEAHNGVGTFCDVGATFKNDTDGVIIKAAWRTTGSDANGTLFLQYEGTGVSGGFHQETPIALSAPLAAGTWLKCVLNQGSVSLVIEDAKGERQLQNMELGADFPAMTLTAKLANFRPGWYMGASTTGQRTSISRFECRGLGPLAYRELYLVTTPIGEPVPAADGSGYYMTADSCGPTTLDYSTVAAAYDRNHMTVVVYDPHSKRIIKETASITQTNATQTYGAQNSKIMFDPAAGLFHFYMADWVGTRGGVCTVLYGNTSDDLMHGIQILPLNSTLADLGAALPWPATYGPSFGNVYDPDVIYYNGLWYFCCTEQSHGYRSFLFSGTGPGTFDTLVGYDSTGAGGSTAVGEGTRFMFFGGVPHVVVSKPGMGGLIIYDLTMTRLRTLSISGGDSVGFPDQKAMFPFQHGGKTTLQVTGFEGEWYTDASGHAQSLAFGHLVVSSVGTFAGVEFLPNTGQ